MKPISLFLKTGTALFLLFSNKTNAQNDTLEQMESSKELKGFYAGFYAGSLFANKKTAAIYDGYGFDASGNKNDFINSFMYRRIVLEFGGGYGQTDYIAQELNVDRGNWRFELDDMPVNLRYNIAFLAGVQLRYCFTDRDAILVHANVSKLNVTGNFTITLLTPPLPSQLGNNIRTFSITGEEKRSIIQLGYQRILGTNEKLNFFVEAGCSVNHVKFTKNQAVVNTLVIDLTAYYFQANSPSYHPDQLSGIGWGVFSGLGLNLNMHPKWLLQLLYSPSYEQINSIRKEALLVQQAVGLRAYYRL